MESRASTQLGENVKLLTFVSIFFLPLGLCVVSYPASSLGVQAPTYSAPHFSFYSCLAFFLFYFLLFIFAK
jgi:hypothetical protein